MIKDQQRGCENCAHFAKHYIKTTSAQITSVHCGHCLDHHLSAKEHRSFPFLNGCQNWQPQEIADNKKLHSIRKSIQIIEQRLSEIVLLLNDHIDDT